MRFLVLNRLCGKVICRARRKSYSIEICHEGSPQHEFKTVYPRHRICILPGAPWQPGGPNTVGYLQGRCPNTVRYLQRRCPQYCAGVQRRCPQYCAGVQRRSKTRLSVSTVLGAPTLSVSTVLGAPTLSVRTVLGAPTLTLQKFICNFPKIYL